MEINYGHPEFAVWHLAETPVRLIPYGALVKWFDQVIFERYGKGFLHPVARNAVYEKTMP